MKKIILLVVALALASCGGKDKKNIEVENAEASKDKYSLVLDGIYENNDSIVVFYQVDGYFKYDKPVTRIIKGNPMVQRIKIDLPSESIIENISLVASTNKDQKYLTLKNISLMNDTVNVVDGDNYKHSQYFLTDNSFSWDAAKQRYNLLHTNKYPPSFSGNDKLKTLLTK